MITGFEEYTSVLNDKEKELIPILIKGFPAYTKDNPIKEPEIVERLRAKGYKISGARLRKLCNFIRSKSILPLIGTSKGYFVCYDKGIIASQIQSLEERADAIKVSAEGLKKFL